MDCYTLALYNPVFREEISMPSKTFYFPELPDNYNTLTVDQCFELGAGTGSSQWNAGAQLALYLAKHYSGGGKALELGCGLGLVSIVMSILGFDVAATDSNSVLLDCTLKNLESNLGPQHTWRVLSLEW